MQDVSNYIFLKEVYEEGICSWSKKSYILMNVVGKSPPKNKNVLCTTRCIQLVAFYQVTMHQNSNCLFLWMEFHDVLYKFFLCTMRYAILVMSRHIEYFFKPRGSQRIFNVHHCVAFMHETSRSRERETSQSSGFNLDSN